MNKASISQPSMTKGQLAEMLGMSLRTFQRRLKMKELEVPRGLISKEKVLEIMGKLGYRTEN